MTENFCLTTVLKFSQWNCIIGSGSHFGILDELQKSEMRSTKEEHSCKFSLHLAKYFQRRRFKHTMMTSNTNDTNSSDANKTDYNMELIKCDLKQNQQFTFFQIKFQI